MNYRIEKNAEGVPTLTLRTQTEDERVMLTAWGGTLTLTRVDDLTWQIAEAKATADPVTSAAAPQPPSKYDEMDEDDLMTAIAEQGLTPPPKKAGRYRRADLVATLTGNAK